MYNVETVFGMSDPAIVANSGIIQVHPKYIYMRFSLPCDIDKNHEIY
jgi:hypothetical protein